MSSIRCLTVLLTVSLLSACGGGGGSSGSSGSTGAGTSTSASLSPGASNVIAVTIGAGPSPATSNVNIPYVSVTVCPAGRTSGCATINNVLLDTGSFGLRLIASAAAASGLTLVGERDALGNAVLECTPFAAGYAWGQVATADITLGSEKARSLPIQIIDDGSTPQYAVPTSCSGTGTALNTVSDFSANGILGLGVFPQDCGNYCDQITVPTDSWYYGCSSTSTCSAEATPLTLQVTNPVILFAKDNNGVVVQLPSVGSTGALTVTGYLGFGIGTESNNGLGSASTYTTDDTGGISTMFNGTTLPESVLDTGSNAYEFDDSSIATCTDAQDFYCPSTTLSLSAINTGLNGTTSQVDFSIANADSVTNTMVNNSYEYAFSNIGSTGGTTTSNPGNFFDWGLPFFFGRTVYFAIDGQSQSSGVAPYFAY